MPLVDVYIYWSSLAQNYVIMVFSPGIRGQKDSRLREWFKFVQKGVFWVRMVKFGVFLKSKFVVSRSIWNWVFFVTFFSAISKNVIGDWMLPPWTTLWGEKRSHQESLSTQSKFLWVAEVMAPHHLAIPNKSFLDSFSLLFKTKFSVFSTTLLTKFSFVKQSFGNLVKISLYSCQKPMNRSLDLRY